MAAKIYTDKDADLGVLSGKTCAVIGFGSQGHAHALNLKESGVKVIIGLYKGSKSAEVASKLGFEVHETGEAVRLADVIMVAVPDTKQPMCYTKDIEPNLTGVFRTPEVLEDVLHEAQVHAADHRIVEPVALGVMSAVRAQVGIVLDVLFKSCGLIGGGK